MDVNNLQGPKRPATRNTGRTLVATQKETHHRVITWTLGGKYVSRPSSPVGQKKYCNLGPAPPNNTPIKITPPKTPFKRRGVYAQAIEITISSITITPVGRPNQLVLSCNSLWSIPRIRHTRKMPSREPPSGSPENNESWPARWFTHGRGKQAGPVEWGFLQNSTRK